MSSDKSDSWQWKYTISDEKLGNSIFQFYNMKWDDAVMFLKRGTVNVLLSGKGDSVEYHFDPMNPDAQLTYLKLSTIVGNGSIQSLHSRQPKSNPSLSQEHGILIFLFPD